MWEYVKSASDHRSWLEHGQEEIVFWGRSNVGKSSLINALAKQKIAKTSSTPGRTRLINYFKTDTGKIIVDLPGYGYAAMSKKSQDKVAGIIDYYFRNDTNPKTVCILIDAKVGFMPIDLEMIEYIQELGIKFDIIITKIDKANQSQKHKVKQQALTFTNDINIFMISSEKKIGLQDIIDFYNL
ncbi:ribosome biogenesis GTP-binding protein YihA/YsxC [Metamycoplasma neophronis]|uniref:Probable GTP-binding protein EngB n=1 Tax=Metamycoplasma neophronis TaxID=872983 RepID=A0ABY2Z5G8_9BACT|nr:ribosome biogenesis GTP-binding protein YihA/YsxC [Metamycoplasma neophronis]TPR54269.1 YihA family ribosome biogenesis GTP-binding protein [Metamycoplasma neophronis]